MENQKLLSIEEICDMAGVGKSTFRRYRKEYPELEPVVRKGKGRQPFFSMDQVEVLKKIRDSNKRKKICVEDSDSSVCEPREGVQNAEGYVRYPLGKIDSKASTNETADNESFSSSQETGGEFALTMEEPPAEKEDDATPDIKKPSTGTCSYGTLPKFIAAAREVMGSIDLDPATFPLAQERNVQATNFFTVEDDGLSKEWKGRVWLNPPFNTKSSEGSTIQEFTEKLIAEYQSGNVTAAICLTDAKTDTLWFKRLVDTSAAIVFTVGRINFMQLDGTYADDTNRCGQAFFYFGHDNEKFFEVFSQFGWCCTVHRVEKKSPVANQISLFEEGRNIG